MHTSGSSTSVKKNLYTCGQCVADRSLFSYVSTVTRNNHSVLERFYAACSEDTIATALEDIQAGL